MVSDDLLVVPPLRADRVDIGRGHLSAGVDEFQRECEQRGGARVVGLADLCCSKRLARQTGLLAERGVRRKAVVARVAVGHRHGDLLTEGRPEGAAAVRAECAPHAREGSRGVRDGAEHRRHGPEGAGDLVELLLDGSGGRFAFDERDVGHVMLLR